MTPHPHPNPPSPAKPKPWASYLREPDIPYQVYRTVTNPPHPIFGSCHNFERRGWKLRGRLCVTPGLLPDTPFCVRTSSWHGSHSCFGGLHLVWYAVFNDTGKYSMWKHIYDLPMYCAAEWEEPLRSSGASARVLF